MAENVVSHKEEEKDIELQRKRFENYKLLSEVIKGFIEDFGKLIAIIGIILTMLSNLGLVAYNAMASNKEKILDIPAEVNILSASTIPSTADNILIPEATITNIGISGAGVGGGGSSVGSNTISRMEHNRGDGFLIRKIKHELFNGGNILLLIFSAIFGIPLFFKKKQKENENKGGVSKNA